MTTPNPVSPIPTANEGSAAASRREACPTCLDVGESTYRTDDRRLVVYPCHTCRAEDHRAARTPEPPVVASPSQTAPAKYYVAQHVTEARRDWILEHCAEFANDPTPSIGRDSSCAVMDYDMTLRLFIAAVNRACDIIERGDRRLLASDGPAGNQPPDISLAEWRTLYRVLNTAREAAR